MSENAKLYISGCFAGLSSLIGFVPSELVKIRIQDSHHNSKLIRSESVYQQVTREIYRAEGARGFYKGFWAHFWRDVPTYGIYFLSYDFFQRYTIDQKRDNGLKLYFGQMMAGGLAGMLTWLFAYPMDVVKSMVQSAAYRQRHDSVLSVVHNLYLQHGVRVFFHGLNSCLLRAFIVNAFCFTTYEWCVKHLDINLPLF